VDINFQGEPNTMNELTVNGNFLNLISDMMHQDLQC
jgi:hypothetical protein